MNIFYSVGNPEIVLDASATFFLFRKYHRIIEQKNGSLSNNVGG